ncbi:hypothetical protein EYF80_052113 [Liparis tanakae]|uniref:Secreted protein n=1 Tax=Liparis tanakae TaxID=230148 RepID=A0A4Z2F904_9TELE|nr:hypothetical protein EYF80_052113 [Liparis tanakae]
MALAALLTTIWCSPQETSSSPEPPRSAWAFRWTASGVTCSVTRYRLLSVCGTTSGSLGQLGLLLRPLRKLVEEHRHGLCVGLRTGGDEGDV